MPRDSPAATVNSVPVPGVATTTSDVSRNVVVTGGLLGAGPSTVLTARWRGTRPGTLYHGPALCPGSAVLGPP